MGYAFISYSTKNQETADAIRNTFIANKIDTWMAPYSIPPGSKYAKSITNAIRHCSCFVLLLSNASQSSEAVDSEVELAALTFKKSIVTVQIEENVVLNDEFTFYIHNKQILPLNKVDVTTSAMKAVLSAVISFAGQTLRTAPTPPPAPQPVPTPPPAPQPAPQPSNPYNTSPYAGQPPANNGGNPYPYGNAPNNYGGSPYGNNGQNPYANNGQPHRPQTNASYPNTPTNSPYPNPPYNNQPINYAPKSQKSKIVAAILAFFLGGIGIHHFYLRNTTMGILSLVFCWTYIPAFVAVIQGIIYLCTDDRVFAMKYNK